MSARSGKFEVRIIFFITSVAIFHVDAQTSCKTLQNAPGICVPILECTFIKQLLRTWPNPPPDHIQLYLQRSQCGSLNGNMHVCCPEIYVTREGLSAPAPSQFSYRIKRQFRQIAPRASETNHRIQRVPIRSDADIANGMGILRSMKCGNVTADRIANGDDAGLGEFPWMVLLLYVEDSPEPMYCGGSLITDQYVLTAAHCIQGSAGTRLARVRLGEHDTKYDPDCIGRRRKRCAPPIVEIDVEKALYHQEYSRTAFSNDIGLIRLARKATLGHYVTPICLPITEPSRTAYVPKMQIAGWGRIENQLHASVLQKARVIVKENSHCNNIFKLITVTSAQLCAGGENNVATCVGDSGGPLFFPVRYRRGTRFVQYGVVGGGSTVCGTIYPDVFASTLAHLDWIAGNLRP